jgi:hypothetical protein
MPERFRKYVLVNTGIILGSFVLFGLIFYFMSQSLAAKADQILSDRAVIATRGADLENLSQLKANASAAETFQKKIDALLPAQDGLIGFSQFLNNMARTHSLGLVFNFTNPPVPPAAAAPGYVTFTAVVEGSAPNIRSFLEELEFKTSRFVVNLQAVDFSSPIDGARANLQGQVFFRQNEIPTPR